MIFPNGHALRDELSWTHYRSLIKVENDKARAFYLEEAVKSNWSTRQLDRQINSFFASKYKLYLPTEEELLNEIKKEYLSMEDYFGKDNKPLR